MLLGGWFNSGVTGRMGRGGVVVIVDGSALREWLGRGIAGAQRRARALHEERNQPLMTRLIALVLASCGRCTEYGVVINGRFPLKVFLDYYVAPKSMSASGKVLDEDISHDLGLAFYF